MGNAVHGEVYANNYGGIDGYCNADNGDMNSNVDCQGIVSDSLSEVYDYGSCRILKTDDTKA